MPAAGQFKCNRCLKYKDPDKKCNSTAGYNVCRDCCGDSCATTCERCGGAALSCSADPSIICNDCGSHKACCTGRCDYCQKPQCSKHLFKCGGLLYCADCHYNRFGLSHSNSHCSSCETCGITKTDCCARCNSCCEKSRCSKATRYYQVKQEMINTSYCYRCEKKVYVSFDDKNADKCRDCGYKTSESEVKSEVKSPIVFLSKRNQFKRNPSNRLVALEIEVSSYVKGKKCSDVAKSLGAAVMSDGSVPGGFECCTAPANGDILIENLEVLSKTFRECGAKADEKAGLHCHVDCSDLSYNDLRKLIMIYARTEKAIYGIIDSRRAQGQYSRPYGPGLEKMVSEPFDCRRDIMSLVFGDRMDHTFKGGFGKGSHGADRYMGLNLSSWWIRGTVEFRMHHGTTKAEKMVPWAMLMAGMVDSAVKATDKEANNWPVGCEGLLKYAPTEEVKWWCALRYQFFNKKKLNRLSKGKKS